MLNTSFMMLCNLQAFIEHYLLIQIAEKDDKYNRSYIWNDINMVPIGQTMEIPKFDTFLLSTLIKT